MLYLLSMYSSSFSSWEPSCRCCCESPLAVRVKTLLVDTSPSCRFPCCLLRLPDKTMAFNRCHVQPSPEKSSSAIPSHRGRRREDCRWTAWLPLRRRRGTDTEASAALSPLSSTLPSLVACFSSSATLHTGNLCVCHRLNLPCVVVCRPSSTCPASSIVPSRELNRLAPLLSPSRKRKLISAGVSCATSSCSPTSLPPTFIGRCPSFAASRRASCLCFFTSLLARTHAAIKIGSLVRLSAAYCNASPPSTFTAAIAIAGSPQMRA